MTVEGHIERFQELERYFREQKRKIFEDKRELYEILADNAGYVWKELRRDGSDEAIAGIGDSLRIRLAEYSGQDRAIVEWYFTEWISLLERGLQ